MSDGLMESPPTAKIRMPQSAEAAAAERATHDLVSPSVRRSGRPPSIPFRSVLPIIPPSPNEINASHSLYSLTQTESITEGKKEERENWHKMEDPASERAGAGIRE